jgi:L-ascorbate metabolism protein UlaG (beta-lactamase superfamily)
MIEPVLKDGAFLADVAQAAADQEHLYVWWLGQSGFLVQYQGAHLLIDPYLSDSLTKKYADTEKPHVRMTAQVVAPERLDFIDVVTSSHNHTDHLDGETLIPLLGANPGLTVIVPEANREFSAQRLQVPFERLTGITCDASVQVDPFTFHALPSAHEELETDEHGRHKYLGYVIQVGSWTLYHPGDTVRYAGMAERLRAWDIHIAFLPINGRDPKRGVAGNLSGPEAVQLAQEIGAGLVVPCHYEMFEFNTVSPQAFISTAQDAGQPYQVLKCAEQFIFPTSNQPN